MNFEKEIEELKKENLKQKEQLSYFIDVHIKNINKIKILKKDILESVVNVKLNEKYKKVKEENEYNKDHIKRLQADCESHVNYIEALQ